MAFLHHDQPAGTTNHAAAIRYQSPSRGIPDDLCVNREGDAPLSHETQPTRFARPSDCIPLPFAFPMAFQPAPAPSMGPLPSPFISHHDAPHLSSFQVSMPPPNFPITDSSALDVRAESLKQGFLGGDTSARSLPLQFGFPPHRLAASRNEFLHAPVTAGLYEAPQEMGSIDPTSGPGPLWGPARTPAIASDASIPLPGAYMQPRNRFVQLLEAKLGSDQLYTEGIDSAITSSSTMPLFFPQSDAIAGGGTLAANGPKARDPTKYLPPYAAPIPARSPALSLPPHLLGPRPIESALHDSTTTRTPLDLVDPPASFCLAFSDLYSALWSNNWRAYQGQSEPEISAGPAYHLSAMETDSRPFGASTAIAGTQPNPAGVQQVPMGGSLLVTYPPMQAYRTAPHAPVSTLPPPDATFGQSHQFPALPDTQRYSCMEPFGAESSIAGLPPPHSGAFLSSDAERSACWIGGPGSTLSDATGHTPDFASHPGVKLGASWDRGPSVAQLDSTPFHVIRADRASPPNSHLGCHPDAVSSANPSPLPASTAASSPASSMRNRKTPRPRTRKRKVIASEKSHCLGQSPAWRTQAMENAGHTESETEAPQDEEKRPAIACHLCRSKKLKCDGARPRCSTCVRKGEEWCGYDKVLRRRGPGKHNKRGKRKARGGAREEEVSDGLEMASGGFPPGGETCTTEKGPGAELPTAPSASLINVRR